MAGRPTTVKMRAALNREERSSLDSRASKRRAGWPKSARRLPSARKSICLRRLSCGTRAPSAEHASPRRHRPINDGVSLVGLDRYLHTALLTAGYASSAQSPVFVAAPFTADMDDVFHASVQGAANAAGLLCKRADTSAFSGDVINFGKTSDLDGKTACCQPVFGKFPRSS
jgi:hypothetical protein